MDDRPHKIMTPEEYAALNIKGWHRVCKNVDGFGAVGVIYEPQSSLKLSWRNSARMATKNATLLILLALFACGPSADERYGCAPEHVDPASGECR